ncbi:MAG: YCF48-related protein, partial [Ignavibacteriaceae bacterium]
RKVLKSYDSGNTWRIIEDSSLIFTQNSIAAINNDTAWIVGGDYGTSNRIIKTIDGGKSFSVQLMGNFGYLNSIKFFNDSCGVAVGNSGSIFITTNGGENWLNKSLGFSQNLNEITISASNTCFVFGEKGIIIKSTNMGKTWVFIEQGSVNSCKKVIFVNDKIGWVLGGDDLLTTTNGGGSWKRRNNSIWYNTIFFIDEYVGWASSILLNGGGDIYKTEDSGNTWNRISNDTIPQINSLYFINRDIGWAIGGYSWWAQPLPINYGYIYKTTNGGISWRRQDTVLNNILNDVHFADKDNGWIVGNRILMRTTNGGTNWIKVESYNLNSIYFIDSKIGYSVGSNTDNRILKTTDGGVNWSEHRFGSYSRDLYSVYFSSYQNGWAVGEKGTICYTTDSGESWKIKSNLTALDLYDVFFINDKIGWITGDNGIILKTEDGGITAVQILENVKPSGFQLFQNYPNPFNPKTTIEYSIALSGFVSIDIYDALGRKVVELLNEYQNSGIYKKVFDGSLLSSGVYFITLKTANFLQSKKMIIIK